ncbi:MAG: hypothetical protein R2744_08030 [Bacteroidales bacterium]
MPCRIKDRLFLVTASSDSEISALGSGLTYLFGDDTMLKTVIRSNPGFIVINNGTITAKWSARNLPGIEKLADRIIGSTENPSYKVGLRLALLFGAVMLPAIFFYSLFKNKRRKS